jgi:hypothetical protein
MRKAEIQALTFAPVRRATCLILALLAAAVTACSSGGGTSRPASTSPPAPQQSYLAALHALHGSAAGETTDELHTLSDARLLSLGRTACGYLNHPADHPYGPANEIVGNGYVDEALTAAAVAKEAKTYLCPTAPGTLTGE